MMMQKVNELVGRTCTHGSPGYPMHEKIVAIDMNVENEEARIHFKSECYTDMPFIVLEELIQKIEGTYLYDEEEEEESGIASVFYEPYKCSITKREGYCTELALVKRN